VTGPRTKPPDPREREQLAEAIRLERCNGCGQPRAEWGPVCSGMTQGDWTHYHSPAWWQQRFPEETNRCYRP
jgi:hypothetical protein